MPLDLEKHPFSSPFNVSGKFHIWDWGGGCGFGDIEIGSAFGMEPLRAFLEIMNEDS